MFVKVSSKFIETKSFQIRFLKFFDVVTKLFDATILFFLLSTYFSGDVVQRVQDLLRMFHTQLGA